MAPRMQDVVAQAMECEGVYLAKKDFYKTIVKVMVFMATIMVTGMGTLITCNNRSVAQMATYTQATKDLSEDQDHTDVYIERLDGVIVRQGLLLESLKTSTTQMAQQINRLEGKVDRTRTVLSAILVEVKKP